MTNEMIGKLEGMGFKRWTKGSMDRLYVNAGQLGLHCEYYNTGNIRRAVFCEREISNSEARRMKASRTYVDIKTGAVFSDNETLKVAVKRILEELG